jgi:hypothetical protein
LIWWKLAKRREIKGREETEREERKVRVVLEIRKRTAKQTLESKQRNFDLKFEHLSEVSMKSS